MFLLFLEDSLVSVSGKPGKRAAVYCGSFFARILEVKKMCMESRK
jgi:hypothetical protein